MVIPNYMRFRWMTIYFMYISIHMACRPRQYIGHARIFAWKKSGGMIIVASSIPVMNVIGVVGMGMYPRR